MKLLSHLQRRFFLNSLLAMTVTACQAADMAPEEVGAVRWGRDMNEALRLSAGSGRPIFALFQEVPGCAGCKQFGREVLSHPGLVAAVHEHFIPVLIHNNAGGKDAAALQRFGEPAWNYQVVRFLDEKGSDLIPRRDRVWETGPLAQRMAEALKAAGKPVPESVQDLVAGRAAAPKLAAFAMDCFWTGEMMLGQIDGVLTTEAGFIQGKEVTLVRYDPGLISLPRLVADAARAECAHAIFLPEADLAALEPGRLKAGKLAGYTAAPASDQKKQLQGTAAARLNLTPEQATKVNAWVRVDAAKAMNYLTPEQRAALR